MSAKISKSSELSKEFAIDSFKIRIPSNECKIINKSINDIMELINTRTGEVEMTKEKSILHTARNGIKTKFQKDTNIKTGKYSVGEFYTIGVNSKTLGSDYLQGITALNVEQVYNYILNLDVIHFDFETFMNSSITDIDIKIDIEIDIDKKDVIETFKMHSKKSREKDKGYRYFKQSKNSGIEYSVRTTTKYKTAPYFKIYHKHSELHYNSSEFTNYYNIACNERLWRFEYTIKNKDHLQVLYNVGNSTLSDVLSISQGKHSDVLTSVISRHLELSNKPKVSVISRVTNMTKEFYNLINFCFEYNVSPEIAFSNFISHYKNRTTIHNKRKSYELAMKLYKDNNNISDEKLKKVYDINGILKALKLA